MTISAIVNHSSANLAQLESYPLLNDPWPVGPIFQLFEFFFSRELISRHWLIVLAEVFRLIDPEGRVLFQTSWYQISGIRGQVSTH